MATAIKQPVFERDYEAYEGDTWDTFKLTWKDSVGLPIDFTTATARCQFKKKRNDAIALLTLTELNGIALGNGPVNIALVLTASQTATLGAGKYFFDLEITQNSKVRTYADCTLTLRQSVTQPT